MRLSFRNVLIIPSDAPIKIKVCFDEGWRYCLTDVISIWDSAASFSASGGEAFGVSVGADGELIGNN